MNSRTLQLGAVQQCPRKLVSMNERMMLLLLRADTHPARMCSSYRLDVPPSRFSLIVWVGSGSKRWSRPDLAQLQGAQDHSGMPERRGSSINAQPGLMAYSHNRASAEGLAPPRLLFGKNCPLCLSVHNSTKPTNTTRFSPISAKSQDSRVFRVADRCLMMCIRVFDVARHAHSLCALKSVNEVASRTQVRPGPSHCRHTVAVSKTPSSTAPEHSPLLLPNTSRTANWRPVYETR